MPHPYVPGVAMLEADASVVRAELDAILADSLFTHSKRCQAFLRYVVERTLDGHADDLKERTVGVEALGRPASYDTSLDPVVRTTAAEVRKRLVLRSRTSGARSRAPAGPSMSISVQPRVSGAS